MQLREFFNRDVVALDLEATAKDEVLKEMIQLLDLDEKSQGILFKMLKRRENRSRYLSHRAVAFEKLVGKHVGCGRRRRRPCHCARPG